MIISVRRPEAVSHNALRQDRVTVMTYIKLHKESGFMQMYARFPGRLSGGARKASCLILLQRSTLRRAWDSKWPRSQVSAMWLFPLFKFKSPSFKKKRAITALFLLVMHQVDLCDCHYMHFYDDLNNQQYQLILPFFPIFPPSATY
jgi:hypothetical protein